MLYKEITVKTLEGIKSRTAAKLVKVAEQFDSQILIEVENKKINAKSIMGVLSLNIHQGESIYVLANGKDEKEAIESIESTLSEEE